jgi:hypothetical protein
MSTLTKPYDAEPAGRLAFTFKVTMEAIPNTPGIPSINLRRTARAAVMTALRKAYEEGFTHPLEGETELEIVSIH